MTSDPQEVGGPREQLNRNAPHGAGNKPFAVIDIGSNSVRLVVYEGLTRAPALLFNEKIQCALGSAVAGTGRLEGPSLDLTLTTLRRFRAIIDLMEITGVRAIATAAVREAEDGVAALAAMEQVLLGPVELLTGQREAELAALGVSAGFPNCNGIVGDLGGGSLELIDTDVERSRRFVTLPIGGLRLKLASGGDMKRARQITGDAMRDVPWLAGAARGRAIYAVGGSWRAIARAHMAVTRYPLRILDHYAITPDELVRFCRELQNVPPSSATGIEAMSGGRRELAPFGAVVLERLVRTGKPRVVLISSYGVREGVLHELKSQTERGRDPLLAACEDLADLRARSGVHARELPTWTDDLFATAFASETAEQRRVRHAACLLSDIGWRVHPEYRGEQSVNLVENGAFSGVDHTGRAFMALAIYYRHEGLVNDTLVSRLRQFVAPDLLKRARVLGAALRTGHMIAIGRPGVIGHARLAVVDGKLRLTLSRPVVNLDGERLRRRLGVLAKELGLDAVMVLEG
ncbi:MAG: exopolyphosphatase [Rhizobiales bacterium]|nr:exopolyphosphatase [Hyphomicrobiales bacterium]